MATPPPPDIIRPPPPSPSFNKVRSSRAATAGAPDSNQDANGFDEDGIRKVLDYDASQGDDTGAAHRGRESMYVTLFDEMITTVLEHEAYLFAAREEWILRHILQLPYEPRYLLVRLLLRRLGKVHPLASIAPTYSAELGEEGVKRAARVLCQQLDFPSDLAPDDADSSHPLTSSILHTFSSEKRETATKPWADLPTGLSREEEKADPELAEAIRVSMWSERQACSGENSPGASTPLKSDASSTGTAEHPLSELIRSHLHTEPILSLAHDETELGLEEVMSCISADELRRIARARKVPPSLLQTRGTTMKALCDVARKQTTLGFTPLDRKGKGRADAPLRRPLMRTSTSERLMLQQLLPCVGDHVIQIHKTLYALVARVNLIYSRTPPQTAGQPALLLPPILVKAQKRQYPEYGQPTRTRIWADRDELLAWERAVTWEVIVSEVLGDNWSERHRNTGPMFSKFQYMSRYDGAKIVRKLWEEVWPTWQKMVAGDGAKPVPPEDKGRMLADRFQTGHVLTRIVYKAADALGSLHEYDLQCEVLKALLAQRRWRLGKRGAWYERLAMTLMTHYAKLPEDQKREKLEEATQVCIDALLDEDTHLIYRPGLSRRLTRLENRLNLPADERHISYAQLLMCETRDLVAERSEKNLGQIRRPSDTKTPHTSDLGLHDDEVDGATLPLVGKSAWIGRDGEVTVEGVVLEWWEDKGYLGYHAESSILTTLFALLMWPVLFHPMPGVFETLYQTAPLDLGEDTFARARAELIEPRLAEMERTDAALAMLREADARERPKATWAVGLSWDFGRTELEEILQCLGGRAMATICRMLCEEYRHRASGVPDLIVWSMEHNEARFVEVKGPGDNLSETQKIWIDVLLGAGVPVEVCRVKDKEEEERKAKEAETKLKRKNSGQKKRTPSGKNSAKDPEPIVIVDSDDESSGSKKRRT